MSIKAGKLTKSEFRALKELGLTPDMIGANPARTTVKVKRMTKADAGLKPSYCMGVSSLYHNRVLILDGPLKYPDNPFCDRLGFTGSMDNLVLDPRICYKDLSIEEALVQSGLLPFKDWVAVVLIKQSFDLDSTSATPSFKPPTTTVTIMKCGKKGAFNSFDLNAHIRQKRLDAELARNATNSYKDMLSQITTC